MGFSKTAPPSTYVHDVHSCVRPHQLPGSVSRFGPPLPGAGPVPSSRFLTALTAFSVTHAAGLLHPAADHGVHRVRVPRSASRPPDELPPRCFTLRRVSLASSLRSRRIPTPSSFTIQGWCDLGALLRWSSPLRPLRVATPRSPILPWVSHFSSTRRLTLPWEPSSRRTTVSRQGPSPLEERSFPWGAAEAGSRAGCVPPPGPTVQRTAFRGALRVGRLLPHAGRRGPGVTCPRVSTSSRPSRGGL
jgi:hypothetical protein